MTTVWNFGLNWKKSDDGKMMTGDTSLHFSIDSAKLENMIKMQEG